MSRLKTALTPILFVVLLLCFNPVSSAASDITNASFYIGSEKSDYPVLRTPSPDSNFRVNWDIQKYIDEMRTAVSSSAGTTSSMQYKIYYEDSNILSVVFKEYRYYYHAAHGSYFIHGVVYDKKNGAKIPLTHYISITPEQVQAALSDHIAKAFEGDGSAELSPDQLSRIKDIPQDYYITETPDGLYIGLVYPPYELAPWAAGIIHILLPMPKD